MSQNKESRNRQDKSGRDQQNDESWRQSRGGASDSEPQNPSFEGEDESLGDEDIDDMDEERDDDDRIDSGPNRRRSIS